MPSNEFEKMASDVLYEFSQSLCVKAIRACQPICQVCGVGKPVYITRFGTVKAACSECIIKEREEFYEHCRREEERDEGEEPDWCSCRSYP